jgi:hypothetical protein
MRLANSHYLERAPYRDYVAAMPYLGDGASVADANDRNRSVHDRFWRDQRSLAGPARWRAGRR